MGHVRVLLPRKLSQPQLMESSQDTEKYSKEHLAPILLEGKVALNLKQWVPGLLQPQPQEWRISAGHQAALRSWGKPLIWKMKASHSGKRETTIFPSAEMTSLLPWDCWWHSTSILGINKMEAHTVYQWLQVHPRESQQNTCMFQCWQKWGWARDHTPSEDTKNRKDAALSPVLQMAMAYIAAWMP